MNDKTIHKEHGSVMVEFAGTLVLLVMLVFGIAEIGRAIYQLNTLTKSVEAGVRYMSRAVDIIAFDSSGASANEQCSVSVANWDNAEQRARNIILYGTEIAGDVTRLPDMEVTSVSVEPHIDPIISHGGACVIKVSAKAKFVSIFGDSKTFPSLYSDSQNSGGLILTADTEERYIGE